MLNTAGLSLSSTPRLTVPLGFFLAAPLSALAAGLLLLAGPDQALSSRWTPAALATTHLLVLGFITPIMCGSLLQILPVLVGTRNVVTARTAGGMALLLTLATGLLSAGLGRTDTATTTAGAVLAVTTLLWFAFRVLRVLLVPPVSGRVRWTVACSILALAVTVILGALLVARRAGWIAPTGGLPWTDAHLAWGLGGWMGLLLVGIAGELLPMFYLSPQPARRLMRALPAIVMIALTLTLPLVWTDGTPIPDRLPLPLVLLALCGFAVAAFISQWQRRRPRRDPTLGFWWLGQAGILAAAAAWVAQLPAALSGVLLIVGAGMSFTSGTLFKIVPFLSWYHLQAEKARTRRRDVRLPTMHGFIGDTPARWQLVLHAATTLLLALAAWPGLPTQRAGGLLLAASALLLWITLLRAVRRYRRIQRMFLADAATTP